MQLGDVTVGECASWGIFQLGNELFRGYARFSRSFLCEISEYLGSGIIRKNLSKCFKKIFRQAHINNEPVEVIFEHRIEIFLFLNFSKISTDSNF